MQKVPLGGQRLGTGNEQNVSLHGYKRSTHDKGFTWRSTISSGTLVPCWTELAQAGDSWDIGLNIDIKTHPTIGPLFGSYKVQLDVFQIPMRPYVPQLMLNKTKIGLAMENILLPQIQLESAGSPTGINVDNTQINPSHLLSHLNIRGLGMYHLAERRALTVRKFNAIPYIAYFDIYKNYYANKQEGIGAQIQTNILGVTAVVDAMMMYTNGIGYTFEETNDSSVGGLRDVQDDTTMSIEFISPLTEEFDADRFSLFVNAFGGINGWYPLSQLFNRITFNLVDGNIICDHPQAWFIGTDRFMGAYQFVTIPWNAENEEPKIIQFPLTNIDNFRTDILSSITSSTAYTVVKEMQAPYGTPIRYTEGVEGITAQSLLGNQEGLCLKTYQSDLFNNWLDTESIDGVDGINEITAIDTTSGSIQINEINLSNKIFKMLTRIAVSDGTYKSWIETVYDEEYITNSDIPVYCGGLSKELVFQKVISNSASDTPTEGNQPLGTLAGRGVMGGKHKGGHVSIRTKEPSYIMAIISLTPRIDYSQGNKWDTNLKTMNDLHKPQLDQIGFQDLITDQMAWWDTRIISDGITWETEFKSAGKQPAWINYMTNVNVIRGNFADINQQGWMVLDRRYSRDPIENNGILDLTTYIDPAKYNHIFAYTRRDAQNFWAQIGFDVTLRRKISASLMPVM